MTGGRLVIFDMDGTLIDSQNVIVASMRRAFETLGHAAPERERTLSIVGLSLPEAMRELAPELGAETRRDLVDAYRSGFVAIRAEHGGAGNSPLYPGARAALERLRDEAGTLLGMATGKARRGLDHCLDMHRLQGFFTTCQTADDHPSKPHPSMIETALAETGIDAPDGVMVGDTEFDVAMGRAAGVRTIGVCWGYHDEDRLRAAGADAVVADFGELLNELSESGR